MARQVFCHRAIDAVQVLDQTDGGVGAPQQFAERRVEAVKLGGIERAKQDVIDFTLDRGKLRQQREALVCDGQADPPAVIRVGLLVD